jgi:hypothetical protein
MSFFEEGRVTRTITNLLIAKLAELFNLDENDNDTSSSLTTISVGSLVPVDFRNWLHSVVKAKDSMFEIMQAPALSDFVILVVERTARKRQHSTRTNR